MTDNPPISIYVNQTKNRITFRIKTGYYRKLLAPQTMNLLWSNKYRITKDENSENIAHLEFTEVLLVHCDIVNNGYHQDWRDLYAFFPNKSFGQLKYILPKNFFILKYGLLIKIL